MTDALFGEPRLAAINDVVEGEGREDLDHYLAIADELGARSLLGCRLRDGDLRPPGGPPGDGRHRGGSRGASLDVARAKPGAERVRWLHGDATGLPHLRLRRRRDDADVGLDPAILTSDSTRRFWSRAEIEDSLRSAGYPLAEVRDAPDRPGREWVFIARKP